MSILRPDKIDFGQVRDDFVPATDYFSQQFAELENERLWPRVWQMACREHEIPKIGDFCTYNIVDDSITIIRTGPDEIKAFHNSCPHRGTRLTESCGHMLRFHCPFHGWQFDLNGKPLHVVDRHDWGKKLSDDEITLVPVKVGRWGGWVYINMDPNCEDLDTFLAPAGSAHEPLKQEGLRFHWVKSAIVPCNWKLVLGMFNEAYHLQQTHKQMLRYWDDYSTSYTRGRHSMFRYEGTLPPGMPSKRLGDIRTAIDLRKGLAEYIADMHVTLNATEAMLMGDAVNRLVDELPADAEPGEVLAKLTEFSYKDITEKGIDSPVLTKQQMLDLGSDWHIFPNHIMISGANSCLAYRARPNGHDPDSAIWDVYSLLRYPAGQEPDVQHEWANDLADEQAWPKILRQDFENMARIQQGLKSRGFRGARTNPVQELPISNLHRGLREFMGL